MSTPQHDFALRRNNKKKILESVIGYVEGLEYWIVYSEFPLKVNIKMISEQIH